MFFMRFALTVDALNRIYFMIGEDYQPQSTKTFKHFFFLMCKIKTATPSLSH